jgi:hypothetical protein
VAFTEILAPANAPPWARNRNTLWNQVEAAEKRIDGQPARRIILALPKELSDLERKKYASQYIKEQFVDRGMVADFAIHFPCPKKNNDNHHLHLLVTTRNIGSEGFGKKNRDWNQKALLEKWRKEWARATNQALANAGFEPCWDHRTLAEQGIDRLPQVHLGQSSLEMESRGQGTDRASRALRIDQANQLVEKMKEIDKELNNEKRIADGETGAQRTAPSGSHGGKNKQQNQQVRWGSGGPEKGATTSAPAPKKYNQQVDRQVEEKMKRNATPTPIPADEWAARMAARRLRKSWEEGKMAFLFPPEKLNLSEAQRQRRRDLVDRWDFIGDLEELRRQVALQNPATAARFRALAGEKYAAREDEKEAKRALHFLNTELSNLKPWHFLDKARFEKEIRIEKAKLETAEEQQDQIRCEEATLLAAVEQNKIEQFKWQEEEKREKEKRELLALEVQENQEAERQRQELEIKRQENALKPEAQKKKIYAPRG